MRSKEVIKKQKALTKTSAMSAAKDYEAVTQQGVLNSIKKQLEVIAKKTDAIKYDIAQIKNVKKRASLRIKPVKNRNSENYNTLLKTIKREDIGSVGNRLSNMRYYLEQGQTKFDVLKNTLLPSSALLLTADKLFEEIMSLKNDFDWVSYKDHHLTVMTEEIFIKGYKVNFGAWYIDLDFSLVADGAYRSFYCIPITPKAKGGSYEPHPHIDRYGIMCMGNAKEVVAQRINQGLLAEFFEVVVRVMKSLGTNPYTSISHWT